MKILQRLLVMVIVLVVGLFGGLYIALKAGVLTSFTEFERIEAVRNTDRALEAVLLTANDQHKRTVEWAQHDESDILL